MSSFFQMHKNMKSHTVSSPSGSSVLYIYDPESSPSSSQTTSPIASPVAVPKRGRGTARRSRPRSSFVALPGEDFLQD